MIESNFDPMFRAEMYGCVGFVFGMFVGVLICHAIHWYVNKGRLLGYWMWDVKKGDVK